VDTWRKQIDRFIESGDLIEDDANLHKVFNRNFTNSFLKGNLTKEMFIDNPRDNSINYAIEKNNAISIVHIQEVKDELYSDKNALGATLQDKIKYLDISKTLISMSFNAKLDKPLTLVITTQTKTFVIESESKLSHADKKPITQTLLENRFKSFNNANYVIDSYDFTQFEEGLSIPFKELSTLKEEAGYLLNDSVKVVKHVDIPSLEKQTKVHVQPRLSILISDTNDLNLCDITKADIYFKLPESFKKHCTKYIDILRENPRLIPWFPAVLIGKDYNEAIQILEQVKPERIVSNNTGIAYRAFEMGIEWVAGPFMNTTNSYALQTLKEELNCAGAFISNEINRGQIKHITRPKNFKLFYSIYHPILMMTSRQCFFQRTVGCNKPSIDAGCMLKCEKATTITNVKGISFAVDKQKGGYPSIYNHEQFLNYDVVSDLSDLFDEFFIDLTNIGSGSKIAQDKAELITHFEGVLSGMEDSARQLENLVTVSTNAQYVQGL